MIIDVDLTDYKAIFSHKGRVDGIIFEGKAENLLDSFDESFKLSLSKAKSILVIFDTDEAIPLSSASHLFQTFEFIRNNSSTEEIRFGLGTMGNTGSNIIKCQILMSGL